METICCRLFVPGANWKDNIKESFHINPITWKSKLVYFCSVRLQCNFYLFSPTPVPQCWLSRFWSNSKKPHQPSLASMIAFINPQNTWCLMGNPKPGTCPATFRTCRTRFQDVRLHVQCSFHLPDKCSFWTAVDKTGYQRIIDEERTTSQFLVLFQTRL